MRAASRYPVSLQRIRKNRCSVEQNVSEFNHSFRNRTQQFQEPRPNMRRKWLNTDMSLISSTFLLARLSLHEQIRNQRLIKPDWITASPGNVSEPGFRLLDQETGRMLCEMTFKMKGITKKMSCGVKKGNMERFSMGNCASGSFFQVPGRK